MVRLMHVDASISNSIKSRWIKQKLVVSSEIETSRHHWFGTLSV